MESVAYQSASVGHDSNRMSQIDDATYYIQRASPRWKRHQSDYGAAETGKNGRFFGLDFVTRQFITLIDVHTEWLRYAWTKRGKRRQPLAEPNHQNNHDWSMVAWFMGSHPSWDQRHRMHLASTNWKINPFNIAWRCSSMHSPSDRGISFRAIVRILFSFTAAHSLTLRSRAPCLNYV